MSSPSFYHFQSGVERTSEPSHPHPPPLPGGPDGSDGYYYTSNFDGQLIPPPPPPSPPMPRVPTPPSPSFEPYRLPSPERHSSVNTDINTNASRQCQLIPYSRAQASPNPTFRTQPYAASHPIPPVMYPAPDVPFGYGAYYYQHPYPQPIPPPPPMDDNQIVKSEKIETTTHGRESPRTAIAYYNDPYNLGGTQETVEVHTQKDQYHICAVCRRPRSSRYHKNHPLVPGQQIIPEVCRKCRTAKSSSQNSEEPSDDKVIVNKGKFAVRETERVRIIDEVPLRQERGRSQSTRRKSKSGNDLVVQTTSAQRRSPSPSPLRQKEIPPGYMLVRRQEIPPPPPPIDDEDSNEYLQPPSRKALPDTEKSKKTIEPPKDEVDLLDLRQLDLSRDEEWHAPELAVIRRRKAEHSESPERASVRSIAPRGGRSVFEDAESEPAQTSDAKKRLSSHPSAFRHGYFMPLEPDGTADEHGPAKRPSSSYAPAPPRPPKEDLDYDSEYERRYDRTRYRYRSVAREQAETESDRPRGILRPANQSINLEGFPSDLDHRRSQESTIANFGGNRVQFFPEVPEASQRGRTTDRETKPSRVRQRYRADSDGPEPGIAPEKLSDYGYWHERRTKNLPPYPDELDSQFERMPQKPPRDEPEPLRALAPGFRYVRVPEERPEDTRVPPKPHPSMFVEPPSTARPASSRGASPDAYPEYSRGPRKAVPSSILVEPPKTARPAPSRRASPDAFSEFSRVPRKAMSSMLPEPPKTVKGTSYGKEVATVYDYSGKRAPTAKKPPGHPPQPMPRPPSVITSTSAASSEPFQDVNVREYDTIDKQGRLVKVREIEEMYYPAKKGTPDGGQRRSEVHASNQARLRDIDIDRISMVDEMGRPVRVREIEEEEFISPDKRAMPRGHGGGRGGARGSERAWRDI